MIIYAMNWKVDGQPFGHAVESGIAGIVRFLTKVQLLHFIDMFPFIKHYSLKCFITDNFIIFQIEDDISYSINIVGKLEDKEFISL